MFGTGLASLRNPPIWRYGRRWRLSVLASASPRWHRGGDRGVRGGQATGAVSVGQSVGGGGRGDMVRRRGESRGQQDRE